LYDRERGLELLLDALLTSGLEIEDLLVEALDAELARALGTEAREHVDEHLRVDVALRDPRGLRRRLRARDRRQQADEGRSQRRDGEPGPGLHERTSLEQKVRERQRGGIVRPRERERSGFR